MITSYQLNKCKQSSFKSFLEKTWLLLIFFISTLGAKPALSASNCPSQIYDNADNYASTIVTDDENLFFLTPMNLRKSVEQCTYFANEGASIFYMTITWNHPWVENKPYRAYVKVKSTGNKWSWELLDLKILI